MTDTSPDRTFSPELALAMAGAAGSAVAAVLAFLITLLAGLDPAIAAGIGAGIPAVLALASLPFLKVGNLFGEPGTVVGASLLAMFFRAVLAVVLFATVSQLTELPMDPMALGFLAGLVGSIAAEMIAASRDPRFFHVDATAVAARRAEAEATRAASEAAAADLAASILKPSEGPAYLPAPSTSSRSKRTRSERQHA